MTKEQLHQAALEAIKAGIEDFCRKHPEQDVAAMVAMAETTLKVMDRARDSANPSD